MSYQNPKNDTLRIMSANYCLDIFHKSLFYLSVAVQVEFLHDLCEVVCRNVLA